MAATLSPSAPLTEWATDLVDVLALARQAAGAAGILLYLPALSLADGLAPGWQAALDDPASPLRAALAQAQLQPGQPADSSWGQVQAADLPRPARGTLFLFDAADASGSALEVVGRLLGRALPGLLAAQASRGQEMEALQRISAALTSTLQLDEILTSTMDGLRGLLDAETAALLLLDDDHGELVFKKALGEDSDWVFQAGPANGHPLTQTCLRTGRPVLANGAECAPARSLLCAPLLARGQVLGAVEVLNKRLGPFTRRDQDLLASLAASAANALYNARLFHELTVANAELEASRWEVARSRHTLQALFDGITHPIYIVDRQYQLAALNAASAGLAGRPVQALSGQKCYAALYSRSDLCPGCRVAETFVAGRGAHWTERRWEQSDQHSEWEISTFPVQPETRLSQVIVFGQDVTDKRRLEASLAQSEKLAAVGQLAAGVAHEINNPLAAIIANAQLLARELAPDDERQESVSLIAQASDRAARVVRGLLDFARQERVDFAPTNINETIEKALMLAEHILRANAVELDLALGLDLPPVPASHDHLQGVWLNLLLNARDALGGQPGRIRVGTRQVGAEIWVTVADTGMGISPERLSRIFEPFYTTKDPGRGTGLGLSTCHRIVKQHGGHIRVESQVGQGTVFTVVLPIGPSPLAPAA